MEINTTKFILFLIGVSFFLISQIFLLIQGIKNYKFYKFDDPKIIVERTLYEQFSQEVYESINTPFSTIYSYQNCCDTNNQVRFNLNLNNYFDCRDIYTSDLKESCRNNIIPNYTDCSLDSKADYNFVNNNFNIKYDVRINFDERIKYCQYFSRFTQKISKIDDNYICRKGNSYTYEQLLYNSKPLTDIFDINNHCPPEASNNCGILDTKNNILCLKEACPYNRFDISSEQNNDYKKIYDRYIKSYNDDTKKIITSIVFSENPPMNHEWDIYVKDTYEDIDDKYKEKRKKLTLKDFGLVGNEIDNSYEKLNFQFTVGEINDSNIIKNIPSSKFNANQNLNIYVRNYIGFKNYDELILFKKKFNEKDPKDNPLYKLSSPKYDPIITIVFSSFFLFLSILSLIFGIIIWNKDLNDYKSKILLIFYILNCIVFIAELIIIIIHFASFRKINIDMDERMTEVLNLYNDRIFSLQEFRIICLVFSFVSLVVTPIKPPKNEERNNEEFIQ